MGSKNILAAAGLGQVLAVLIAITASTSTMLVSRGFTAPLLQTTPVYFLQAVVFATVVWCNQQTLDDLNTMEIPSSAEGTTNRQLHAWWTFALLALIDVEANYLVVSAFRYTSLTSVSLLDSFSIPAAVVLSILILGAMYKKSHYIGCVLCLTGLFILVLSDQIVTEEKSVYSSPLFGDFLVLCGATFYALSNVLQEWLLADIKSSTLLSMQGRFGFIISLSQALVVEVPHLLKKPLKFSPVIAPFAGYVAAMFTFYSLVPLSLQKGGAAMLNVSLLSSDLWTGAARMFFFEGFGGYSLVSFCVSLGIVVAGLVVYTSAGSVQTSQRRSRDQTYTYTPVHSLDTVSSSIEIN